MSLRMTATEARVGFGEVLRRVSEDDETVVVEKAGKPMAVVVSIGAYERLRDQARSTQERDVLEEARRLRERIAERRAGQPLAAPEDMIAEARRIRDEQLRDSLY